MKKVSTVAGKQSRNFSQPKLTIGWDLGDRWSGYCVLDEAGSIVQEQKLGTTPKVRKESVLKIWIRLSSGSPTLYHLSRRPCECRLQWPRILYGV